MNNKLILAGLMLALILGCANEKDQPEPGPSNESTTISITAKVIDTKTTLGPLSGSTRPVLWQPGDQLWVRSAAQVAGTAGHPFTTSADKISADSKEAVFSGEAPAVGPYVAVYPYAAVATESSNTELVLNLPGEQNYVSGSFDPRCDITAASWNAGSTVSLSHLFGLLRLNFTGTATVGQIVVSENDPSVILWGRCRAQVNVSDHTIGAVEITNTEGTRNTVKLVCREGVPLGGEPTDFYIVAPPGAFSKGFTCTVYDTNLAPVSSIRIDTDCTIKRGCVTDMKAVNPEETLFSGGKGTEAEPYLIATPQDLVDWSEYTNGSEAAKFTGAFYKQTATIDMAGSTFTPVAQGGSFTGSYDADGYSIKNLKIASEVQKPAGFIAKAEGATLKNLKLEEANVDSKYVYCGALVGYATSCTIENCTVSGQVRAYESGITIGSDANSGYSGGLVGWMDETTLRKCTLEGEATFYGKFSGGCVGYAKNSTIEECRVTKGHTVNVYYHWAGGVVGKAEGANTLIKNCSFEGNLTNTGYILGGIVGQVMGGRVEGCVFGSYGNMGSDKYFVGGIVGAAVPTAEVVIDKCATYGVVKGQYSVGAVVGYTGFLTSAPGKVSAATQPVTISNCASIGAEVTATGNNGGSNAYSLVTGLCGWTHGASKTTIKGCYVASALIQTTSVGNRGALAGISGYQNCTGTTVYENCYTTITPSTVLNRGEKVTDVGGDCFFGAIYARCTQPTTVRNCFWDESMQKIGPAEGKTTESGNQALTTAQLSDGTLLAKLQASANGTTWIAGTNGLPTIEGLPADPHVKPKAAKRLSIIGDSISTFKGWIPGGYSAHYPATDGTLTLVSETYWYRLVHDYMKDCEFDTNISFSGSTVTNTTDANYKAKYGTATNAWFKKDFTTRFAECGGMGRPDIILIHGGTNDWAHNADPLAPGVAIRNDASNIYGGTKPSDAIMTSIYATADAAKTRSAINALPDGSFCEAYVKLLCQIRERYPQCKVVCIIGDYLSQSIEQSIIEIAGHYGAKTVNLFRVNGFNDLGGYSPSTLSNKGSQPNMPKHDYSGDVGGCHPGSQAMKFIAEKIYTELGTWLEE